MNAKAYLPPRCSIATAMLLCLGLFACAPAQQEAPPLRLASADPPPAWAYPIQPPFQPPSDDGTVFHVPGSDVGLTRTQLRDLFVAPNWHPGDQPPLPGIVGKGHPPDAHACGFCHYPNGQGRPENSAVAGLSAGYIAQQMLDYRNGLRKSSEPRMRPPEMMLSNAKAANDEDIRVASEYFSKLPFRPWLKVVETDTVPKTQVSAFMLVALPDAGNEPLGERIIELAQDVKRTTLRDPRSGFVAYVPVGSVAKGRELATTGGRGRTTVCSSCHGPGLKGMGDIPPLAGRSPSYELRQLYDFQSGARAGLHSAQMKDTVSKLTMDDMISLVAYAASLPP